MRLVNPAMEADCPPIDIIDIEKDTVICTEIVQVNVVIIVEGIKRLLNGAYLFNRFLIGEVEEVHPLGLLLDLRFNVVLTLRTSIGVCG